MNRPADESRLENKPTTKRVHELLVRLGKVAAARPECRSCDCLQGFLTQLELDAHDNITGITAQFKIMPENMHGCLGCDPCPPGALFAEYLRSAAQEGENSDKPAKLAINSDVCEQMVTAARSAAPLEACGLLGGVGDRVTKCYVLKNADASPEHFSMLPEEQFATVKDMRASGLKMLGIWHSHPASPARMSQEDLRLAYTPDVAYVIVSLAESNKPVIRSFVVRDDMSVEIPTFIEREVEGQS